MLSLDLKGAIEKYGVVENGIWPREAEFCSSLVIPPDLAAHWINMVTYAPTARIYCNKDIQAPLVCALQNVRDRGLLAQLKTFDGCFMIRDVRAQPGTLSAHAYALALDLNAATNQLGSSGDLDPAFVKCFTDEGFVWGGGFERPDPMHFTMGW
jgi:hypothetical protein